MISKETYDKLQEYKEIGFSVLNHQKNWDCRTRLHIIGGIKQMRSLLRFKSNMSLC